MTGTFKVLFHDPRKVIRSYKTLGRDPRKVIRSYKTLGRDPRKVIWSFKAMDHDPRNVIRSKSFSVMIQAQVIDTGQQPTNTTCKRLKDDFLKDFAR